LIMGKAVKVLFDFYDLLYLPICFNQKIFLVGCMFLVPNYNS